jgi:Uma2 family endonuclease
MVRSVSVIDQDIPYVLMLNIQSLELTDTQFSQLCQDNPDLRFELTARRELVIMAPTGSKTGWRNSKLNQRLANWAEQDGVGLSFDSSTGFTLPDDAKRSPNAAWVRRERWDALSEEQQGGFAPLYPDFVAELRLPEDCLSTLQEKMSEYIENGAHLGWLLDPLEKRVYINRLGQRVERLENPVTVGSDPVLPGFVFHVREIWEPEHAAHPTSMFGQ